VSRIGRRPIAIDPKVIGVTIAGPMVTVKGPKGSLTRTFHPDMAISQKDGTLVVERPSESGMHRALHGLSRSLLSNMVEGVTKGYSKALKVNGVGYRAQMDGKKVIFQVGFSHPVPVEPPQGIQFAVDEARDTSGVISYTVRVEGIDKELVGETAARLRRIRPPEPYKGKGISYVDERIRRKAGKAGKVGAKK
jgi:large subunit ribosomal protein L6